jgi:hypothetical protein
MLIKSANGFRRDVCNVMVAFKQNKSLHDLFQKLSEIYDSVISTFHFMILLIIFFSTGLITNSI